MIYDDLIETLKRQHAYLVEIIGLVSLRIERDGDLSGIDRINLAVYKEHALDVEFKIKRAEEMDLAYAKLLDRQAEKGSIPNFSKLDVEYQALRVQFMADVEAYLQSKVG